jgi:hypothetical protein
MEEQKYLNELHTQHNEWVKKLNFVRDEIETFKNRLGEVVNKNHTTEVLAPAEGFQNQFIRHNEVIDELIHDINEEEHKVVINAKLSNIAANHRKAVSNASLQDRMETFDKIYDDLKHEYLKYLTKVF